MYIKGHSGFLLTVYMSKGQKIMLCTQYRYIQCYAERVERLCYVHNIDKFNAMSESSKDYVIYTI